VLVVLIGLPSYMTWKRIQHASEINRIAREENKILDGAGSAAMKIDKYRKSYANALFISFSTILIFFGFRSFLHYLEIPGCIIS